MAELRKGRVSLSEDFEAIAEQGFGERDGKKLLLAPFEALYLVEKKKIEVKKGKRKMGFDELLMEFKKKNKKIESVFSVFRDLRVAGYIARDGKCEIPCFRVYARGVRPEEEPARYLLWIVDLKISLEQLSRMLGRAHALRKKAVFAVAGRKTITYFKIDTTKF